jgi:hypothetical protein
MTGFRGAGPGTMRLPFDERVRFQPESRSAA